MASKYAILLLITAYPDDAIRERALNAGVAAYLVKPFSEKELLDSIDTALKHKVLACADQVVIKKVRLFC